MDIITLNDVSKAIANRIGITMEEARRSAGFVLDIFGFDDRVIDNILGHEDRQLFYLLESVGMLSTERDEITLYDGSEWRTFYWVLKKNTILKFAENRDRRYKSVLSTKRHPKDVSEGDIYSMLQEDVWTTRKIKRKNPLSSIFYFSNY